MPNKLIISARSFRREFEPMTAVVTAATMVPLVCMPLAFLSGGLIFAILRFPLNHAVEANSKSLNILYGLSWTLGLAFNCWVMWQAYSSRVRKFELVERKTKSREIVFEDGKVLISRRLAIYRDRVANQQLERLFRGEVASLSWLDGSQAPPTLMDETHSYLRIALSEIDKIWMVSHPELIDGLILNLPDSSITVLCYFDEKNLHALTSAFGELGRSIQRGRLVSHGRHGFKLALN